MKRSEINQAIRTMENMTTILHFPLPPFCFWTPEDWHRRGHEYDEIVQRGLGWDITDYGQGDFSHFGFSLITLRNGKAGDASTKPYAEKLMLVQDGQHTSLHYHRTKMEDIINRGGGVFQIQVWNAGTDGRSLAQTPVAIEQDGRAYTVPAGAKLCINPGESISIRPGMYHTFSVAPGTGHVLMGEVSMCNDDAADNVFHDDIRRFSSIEEDELPYRLLCGEYPALL